MNAQDVRTFVGCRLKKLRTLPEPQWRAELAELRRGIGHRPGELPELWGAFLQEMPEEFQGSAGPTRAEWAVYLTLTLYALHQQSNEGCMDQAGYTLGRAVRQLAEQQTRVSGQDWTESSVLRRFNALATAQDITEISYHLRGMIQLLRNGGIPLDYPQLAADLYKLQCDDPRCPQVPANVRLQWGQDLYHNEKMEPSEMPEKEK